VVSIGGQAYVATGDTGRQAALESELNAYLLRDDDNDGLLNGVELEVGTNASNADTDGDKLPDGVEVLVGMNPLDIADATYDSDGDGIINAIEVRTGTDPFTATGVMQH
ncbi:MAG: hypothetical protein KC925_01685, partial [Candidatus Doudnabacteria bacterium]|nr:hypothetical protein [Candidatus Doudnabacteria bacterium]